MGTLLEAIGIVLKTYFRFEFPNEYHVGDSLRKMDRMGHLVWFSLFNMIILTNIVC